MKKNLIERKTANEIIERANKLQLTANALWGTMNVTEMLHHCNLANRQILTTDCSYQKPTFKQRFMKMLSLYVVPTFPKNIKGAEHNDTKGKIDVKEFSQQKEQFIEVIGKFPENKKELTLIHPAFGYLTTKQWGVAAWMHMDHHLRQFGV